MRRKFTTLILAASCVLAVVPTQVHAAPADPIKVTLSDYSPSPGQYVAVWCGRCPPNRTIKIYIDSLGNQVSSMTTSATGYGRGTFKLSRYAKVGSRHAVVLLLNASTGANARAPFTVSPVGK